MEDLIKSALYYNQNFRFNIIPLKISKAGKKPALKRWKHLQNQEQSANDIEKLNWNNQVNGLGAVNGTFHTLDFDECNDEDFILTIAQELGLTEWIVKTGKGYHFHLSIQNLELVFLELGYKGVYKFTPKEKGSLHHCELRVKDCYTTLPPSIHYNGNTYTFLSNNPNSPPQNVDAKKILDVLQKYFIIKPIISNNRNDDSENELINNISNGVSEGSRHTTLVKYFGMLFHQGSTLDLITAQVKNWNLRNIPPIDDKEIDRQIRDLWNRYSNGRDNIFYQFQNCLLGLNDEDNLLLLKILSYSVIEYDGDKKIISELNLKENLKKYHKECKVYVKYFEDKYGKDQILRIGKNLFIETLSGSMSFDEFTVYCAITSWLGRKKSFDTIANTILIYRAIGFKCEADYLTDERYLKKPISYYKLNKARMKLKKRKLIDYGHPIKGRMNFYSTYKKEGNELADIVGSYLLKKIEKQNAKKDVWTKWGDKIREAKRIGHS